MLFITKVFKQTLTYNENEEQQSQTEPVHDILNTMKMMRKKFKSLRHRKKRQG